MKSLEEVVMGLMVELNEKRSGVGREEESHPASLMGQGKPNVVYFNPKKRREN
jgi:hypothetical protein